MFWVMSQLYARCFLPLSKSSSSERNPCIGWLGLMLVLSGVVTDGGVRIKSYVVVSGEEGIELELSPLKKGAMMRKLMAVMCIDGLKSVSRLKFLLTGL